MEYQVVFDSHISAFENRVQMFLSKGWKLQGGVSISGIPSTEFRDGTLTYAQAMIKEK
jgi:hypothetical protein